MFKRLSLAMILSFVVILAALVVDIVKPFETPPEVHLLRALTAMELELQSEAGDLVLVESDSRQTFDTSYEGARRRHAELIDASRILSILEEGDLGYLETAISEGGSVSNELKTVARMLKDPRPEKDSKELIQKAARQLSKLNRQLKRLEGSQPGEPMIFRFEPAFLADYRTIAERETGGLEDLVNELKRKSAWESSRGLIIRDLEADATERDELIELCLQACQHSRVAYVFLYSIPGGSVRDAEIRERFLDAQKDAIAITNAVAEDSSLQRAKYANARGALREYAASMKRRWQEVGNDR